MKVQILYGLLVIGLPIFAGLLVAGLIRVPLGWLCSEKVRARVNEVSAVLAGLASILAAIGMFRMFDLRAGLEVPIICAVWVTAYFFIYHQSKLEMCSFLAGIAIGWLAAPIIFR